MLTVCCCCTAILLPCLSVRVSQSCLSVWTLMNLKQCFMSVRPANCITWHGVAGHAVNTSAVISSSWPARGRANIINTNIMTLWWKRLQDWLCSWFYSVPLGVSLNRDWTHAATSPAFYIISAFWHILNRIPVGGLWFVSSGGRGEGYFFCLYRDVQIGWTRDPTISFPWVLQCFPACKINHAIFSLRKVKVKFVLDHVVK